MHALEARAIAGVSKDHIGGHTGGLPPRVAPGILAMGIVLMIGYDGALERVPAAE
jgi:hypothetical protein